MIYSTTYRLLGKDMEVIDEYINRACFADIVHHSFQENIQYLKYEFNNHSTELTVQDMYRYFLFLKNIPEFTLGMPYDVYEMATKKEVVIDLELMNGLQLFSLLTVIRAVVEDPAIVKEVLKFDPTKEYTWTKLGILKACGSLHYTNRGHWLTSRISLKNVNKSPAERVSWNNTKTAKSTGLTRGINVAFEFLGDGFAAKDPITPKVIEKVRNEHSIPVEKPKPKRKPAVKKTKELILDF